MELYLPPIWAKPETPETPETPKKKWVTDDPEKRARMLKALEDGRKYGQKSRHVRSRNAGKRARPVSVYDLDGNYLRSFVSISAAARHYGVDVRNVHKCCNGKCCSLKSMQFRYADVMEWKGEKMVRKTPIEPYHDQRRKQHYQPIKNKAL